MSAVRPPLLDQLPAVLAESDFLAGFLAAFEAALGPIEAELDALPSLYEPAPVARLAARADRGSRRLRLDTAAGFLAGDVVQIEDLRHPSRSGIARVEFATVAVVELDAQPVELSESLPNPLPRVLGLTERLRRPHVEGGPVRLVGATAGASVLGTGAPAGGDADEQVVSIVDASILVSAGDVIQIDEGDAAEFAQVAAVDGDFVTIAPALLLPHPIGRPVAVRVAPATTAPGAQFGRAERAGTELVVAANALAHESVLELDTVAGIERHDVLQLCEPDPRLVEFVRVGSLPTERPRGPGVDRYALRLHTPLRHPHAAGTPVAVVDDGAVAGETALTAAAGRSSAHVTVADLRPLAPSIGDVLAIGSGAALDHVQVVAIAGDRIALTPHLHHDQPAGARVARLVGSGGTGFLAWLSGWFAVTLRPDRGERWNADLLRLAGALAPWRGTRRGVEAWLRTAVRGEADATVLDLSNPFQPGVSRLGVDAVLCGNPHFFGVWLRTNPRVSRMHNPQGLAALIEAAQASLAQERPAFADYDIRLEAHTMQLGVDSEIEVGARLGETTLLWDEPIVIPGDDERRGGWRPPT